MKRVERMRARRRAERELVDALREARRAADEAEAFAREGNWGALGVWESVLRVALKNRGYAIRKVTKR